MSPTKTTNKVFPPSAMAKSILASVDRLAAKLRETNSTVDVMTMKNAALTKECGSLKIRLRLAEGDHSTIVSNLQKSLDSKSQQYEATKVLLYAADQVGIFLGRKLWIKFWLYELQTITKLRSEKRCDELQQLEEQQHQQQLANQQGKEPLDQLDESLVAQHGEQLVDQPDEPSVNQQENPSASEQDQALVDHQIQLSVDQQHQPSVNEQDQLQGNQQGELFVDQRTQPPVDAQNRLLVDQQGYRSSFHQQSQQLVDQQNQLLENQQCQSPVGRQDKPSIFQQCQPPVTQQNHSTVDRHKQPPTNWQRSNRTANQQRLRQPFRCERKQTRQTERSRLRVWNATDSRRGRSPLRQSSSSRRTSTQQSHSPSPKRQKRSFTRWDKQPRMPSETKGVESHHHQEEDSERLHQLEQEQIVQLEYEQRVKFEAQHNVQFEQTKLQQLLAQARVHQHEQAVLQQLNRQRPGERHKTEVSSSDSKVGNRPQPLTLPMSSKSSKHIPRLSPTITTKRSSVHQNKRRSAVRPPVVRGDVVKLQQNRLSARNRLGWIAKDKKANNHRQLKVKIQELRHTLGYHA